MTPAIADDLFLLQRELGIGAQEALQVRPAWEIDIYTARLRAQHIAADPQDAPPPLGDGALTLTTDPEGGDDHG